MINDFLNAFSFSLASGLFVHEIMHGLIAVPFAIFIFLKTGSFKFSLLVLTIAYLIDLDHWVDYFLYYGLDISIYRFLQGNYFHFTSRAVVPFHAWEWTIMLAIWAYHEKKWKSYKVVAMFALLAHLVLDTYHIGKPIFYSIIYRLLHNFTNLN